MSPEILFGRYVLTNDPPRTGGMSIVKKAFDPIENRFCAIKRIKSERSDDLRWKESFNREYAALNDLSSHPNIVALYDAGVDDAGFYMVLEWVQSNLVDWIGRTGPIRWDDFYSSLGRPILDALEFAQSRGWSHRDIKPQNILITDSGVPKISDYGIAKQFEKPVIGLTFNQFRSAPFTPPEDDGGQFAGSRDCFSWAAVAVYCLTAKIPVDYGSLAELVASLDRDENPMPLIQEALSNTPAERPPLASALLADLNRWSVQHTEKSMVRRRCYLEFDPTCLVNVLQILDSSDRKDAERAILEELNELDVGFRYVVDAGGVVRHDRFRISATTWGFEFLRSNTKPGRFIIRRAWPSRAGEVERYRDTAYRTPIEFTFAIASDSQAAIATLDEIAQEIDIFEAESRARQLVVRRERIFRVWYAFLRAKADYEARKENAIPFVDCKVSDQNVVLTTELPQSSELVGQSRIIRMTSGHHIFCDIVDVNLDEVVIVVTFGGTQKIPRRGRLEVNTVAAEKAIERQRRALDAVNYDRAASPRLKSLLVDPACARPPLNIVAPKVGGGPFDPEKAEILKRALGVQDLLAIQGPPGTGKTRLIEEILVQYLTRYPGHRILLSAQTHVALDNVIERVRVRQSSIDIVRIGRLDEPKISAACRDLVLDRKTQAWSEQVRLRARNFMSKWADQRGIDRSSIETGMLAERLILLLQQQRGLRTSATEASQRAREVEQLIETKLSETGSAESAETNVSEVQAQQAVGEFREALARVNAGISDARERLRIAGGYGTDLAELNEEGELVDWSSLLLGDGPDQAYCRQLLELQEEWSLRVGRSSDFHAAMLASAQIVAGTCIGMASVRGMAEVVYDLCVIDEASKATATEVLVPMSRSRKWILVGDPEQLPPFFEEESVTQLGEFDEAEVRETILDRVLKSLPSHSSTKLVNQHRMVKPIGDMISYAFYNEELNSPKSKPDVTFPGVFPKPVTWLSTSDLPNARETPQARSFHNDSECRAIREALTQIDFVAKKRKAVYDIALIAGYVAQVKALQDFIRERLHEWSGLKITCSTVDAFQGSEAEICIYSVTRSNDRGRLGFLREKPRLNVALSRGRSALIIVGDDRFCSSIVGENPFRKVLDFINANPDYCERRPL